MNLLYHFVPIVENYYPHYDIKLSLYLPDIVVDIIITTVLNTTI